MALGKEEAKGFVTEEDNAVEAASVETANAPVTGLTFESFQDLEHDAIVKLALRSKDYTDNAAMKVANVTVRTENAESKSRNGMTIVVNRPLKAFMNNSEGVWSETTSKNIFLAAFQIASVLKACGESVLANHVAENPKVALMLLEGARVSTISRHYSAGEVEVNPFASKASEYAFERDTVRHYLYDIVLGESGKTIKQMLFAKTVDSML